MKDGTTDPSGSKIWADIVRENGSDEEEMWLSLKSSYTGS